MRPAEPGCLSKQSSFASRCSVQGAAPLAMLRIYPCKPAGAITVPKDSYRSCWCKVPTNVESKHYGYRKNESKVEGAFIKDLHVNCKQSMKKGDQNGSKMDLSEGTVLPRTGAAFIWQVKFTSSVP